MPTSEFNWDYADSISDKIVELARQESRTPGFQPAPFYAGLLMGLLSFARTAPKDQPETFQLTQLAAVECLRDLAREFPIAEEATH